MTSPQITAFLADLNTRTLPEIWEAFTEATGEVSKAPNKTYLLRRIREALEATAADETRLAERNAPSAKPTGEILLWIPAKTPEQAAKLEALAKANEAAMATKATEATEATDEATTEILHWIPATTPEQIAKLEALAKANEAAKADEATEAAEAADEATEATDEATEAADEATEATDEATEAADEATKATHPLLVRGAMQKMTTEDLVAAYGTEVGRPTGSTDRGYLIWKIRETLKGALPAGPTKNASTATHEERRQVVLQMPPALVNAIDDAAKAAGQSRNAWMTSLLMAYAHGNLAAFQPTTNA